MAKSSDAFVERTLRVGELVVDDRNARRHGDRNVKAIKSSLMKFGQVEPLVIQARTNRVIAGHGRLAAMRELGFTHARCVVLDVTDRRARAIGVALNRTGELAEWDFDVLAQLLVETTGTDDEGLGLEDLGFVQAELTAMLATPGDVDGDEPARKPKTTVTVKVVVDVNDGPDALKVVEDALLSAGLDGKVSMR